MQTSGAQIREGVKEACLGIDVPQQVSDADARHQDIDGVVKAFGGGRRDRIVRGDLEAAAFETHALDMAAEEPFAHFVQPLAQRLAPAFQPRQPVGLQSPACKNIPRLVQRRQVGVEAAVIPAAFHPNVAGTEPVAQRGDDGRLVDAPSGPSVFQNLGFPVLAGKRHRHEVRQIALAGAVVFLQEFHGCLEVLSGLRDAEAEGLQKRRRETPQLGVAPRGQGQGVLGRQVLEGGDLLARPEQAVPADLFIEDGERVLLLLSGSHHGIEDAAEEPDQPPDLRLAVRPGAFLPVL